MYMTETECSYLDLAQAEQRRLEAALREAESQLAEGPRSEPLRELRDGLVRHFSTEEVGGCLEEAVSRSPSLSRQVLQLEREHPGLLAALDDMIALVEVGEIAVAQQEFSVFAFRLREHEAKESRLLQLGFNVSLEP